MSFRSKQPVAPARRRSASSLRSGNTSSLTNGYSTPSRPRSMSYYAGASTTPYSSYSSSNSSSPYASYSNYGTSNYGGGSSYSSSNYKSPYYSNGYRSGGASSSYTTTGSLTIPAKTLANVNYGNNYGNEGHRSRQASRNGSYSRDRSHSRSRSQSAIPGMGSKSLSMNSLNSEGYCSGTERSNSRSSRIGSANDLILRGENGEIDYKKLYEQALSDNDKLKDKLRKSDEELRDTKTTLEKLNTITSKNSLSELEKRERRAMERKLSEMEEELKQVDLLKKENQRLKEENGALIRVISKLSKS